MSEEVLPLEGPEGSVTVGNETLSLLIDKTHRYNGDPLFVWGGPGIGKTDLIKQYCVKNKIGLIVINAAVKEPTDIIGVPIIDRYPEYEKLSDEDKRKEQYKLTFTSHAMPSIWPRSNRVDGLPMGKYDDPSKHPENYRGGIIFVDELNVAPEPVLKACLELFGSRSLQGKDYEVPSNWRFIAAGNRDGENEIVELSAAMLGRFQHIHFKPDVNAWLKWGSKEYPEKNFDGVVNPDKIYRKTNIESEILTFIGWKNSYMHHLTRRDIEEQRAYASPRTWFKASSDLAYLKHIYKGIQIPMSLLQDCMNSNVGKAAGGAFCEFIEAIQEVPVETFRDVFINYRKAALPKVTHEDYTDYDGVRTKENRYEPQKSFAFVVALAAERDGNIVLDEFENFIKYLIRLKNKHLATVALANMIDRNPHLTDDEMYPQIKPVMRSFFKTYGYKGKEESRLSKIANIELSES